MTHAFRLMLGKEASGELAKIAGKLKTSEEKYQIGVGTVAARLIERIVRERPELLSEFFPDENTVPARIIDESPTDAGAKSPKPRSLRQAKK